LIDRLEHVLGPAGVEDTSPNEKPEVIMPPPLHPMTVAGH
jgi:hypothetical protein